MIFLEFPAQFNGEWHFIACALAVSTCSLLLHDVPGHLWGDAKAESLKARHLTDLIVRQWAL